MPNPFRAYGNAPAFFRLASIYTVVMAVLIYGGCPRPPTPTDNSNDNASSNANSNSSNSNSSPNKNGAVANNNGSVDNLNINLSNSNDNDVFDPEKPKPDTITFEEIVRTGDFVPDANGTATAAVFSDFGSPIIDASGRIAFWARYTGGSGHGGLYVWIPAKAGVGGTLKAVIDDSGNIPAPSATPGQPTAENFICNPATLDIRTQPLTWSGDGRLLFVSAYDGPGNKLMIRWSAQQADPAKALLRVADTQAIADAMGTRASTTIVTFANIGCSDEGLVFFQMHYFDISANESGDAICKAEVRQVVGTNKIIVTPVVPVASASPSASDRGAVPEQGPSAAFMLYDHYTTLSPDGYLLFQGAYDSGTGTHGAYLRIPGDAVVRVIDSRPDSEWLGLDPGVVIGNDEDFYEAIAISTNVHIAIQTPIIAGGSSVRRVILWDFALGEWTVLVTDEDRAITDLLSGVSDGGALLGLAGSEPYIVGVGAAVDIAANLSPELDGVALEWMGWGATSGSINNSGHAIVPYVRVAESTQGLGFWNGEELLIIADQLLNIPDAEAAITEITADSMPETDRPGRSGILNDNDEAVFRLDLGTNNQAIYIGRVTD